MGSADASPICAEGSPGLDDLVRDLLFSLDHDALAPVRSLWPTPIPLRTPMSASAPAPRSSDPLAALVVTPDSAPPARSTLPVLDWLAHLGAGRDLDAGRDLGADPHHFAGPLIEALRRIAPSLGWRQTYTLADVDADFLRNYGYTEIVGPAAPRFSETLACGFLLLGPRTLYPRHRHEAQEIYVSLSGEAAWLQGDGVWRQRPAGTLIYHASGEPHAMRTAADPLLALYVWWGTGLRRSARLDSK